MLQLIRRGRAFERLFAVLSLSLCAPALSQSTIDNDPDMAPGFTNSVFHTPSVDSINLYNGQITVPIAIGPSYPLGPKLRYQAVLTYNSYGPDYPDTSRNAGNPMAGDTAFGIGWSFTLGAIKYLPNTGYAYVAPDGSQHIFSSYGTSPGYFKTTDATAFYLHDTGSSPRFEMWDGDGNHYVFGQIVTGYDDAAHAFFHDYGRGRNGWYLTLLTDPFGNGLTASYPISGGSIGSPCWVVPYCTPADPGGQNAPPAQMFCNTAGPHWVPQSINLTSGATISIGRKASTDGVNTGYEAGLIGSFTFQMPVNGVQTTRTWSLDYGETDVPAACGLGGKSYTYRLTAIRLPNDIPGSPAFRFDYRICPYLLMTRLTVPTGGTIDYAWGQYTFYHGRIAHFGCNPRGVQGPHPVWVSSPLTCSGGSGVNVPVSGNSDCSADGTSSIDTGTAGVISRTETDPVSGLAATTTYTQYAFPFGEHDNYQTASYNAQSLTVVVFPPDANGKQRSKSVLFYAGSTGDGTYPGDRTGADIREADYDFAVPAYPQGAAALSQPVCKASGSAAAFCPNNAFRVTTRAFEVDGSPTLTNRHLQSETRVYGPTDHLGQCPTCLSHIVAYSNSAGRSWDAPTNDPSGNGRHYNIETHAGNLGSDFRQVVTTWSPTITPWFPGLFDKRVTTDATGSLNQYFDFDHGAAADGFLRGTVTWDSGRSLGFGECSYRKTSQNVLDVHGNAASRYTSVFTLTSEPNPQLCTLLRPDPASWGAGVGTDGTTFATDFTYQNGQKVAARDVNGTSTAWPKYDVTRDPKTGWITSSRDSAGLQTAYLYDSLGRPTSVTPPQEAATLVTYDSPTQTTAVRNGGSDSSTWSQFVYDGFGRTIRERRQMPGGAYAKRFSKYDGRGNATFQSEWVTDATGESLTLDVPANCVFSGSSFPTNVPSSAPGTHRACFDPYGRPQLTTGAAYSSQATVSRTDARPSMTAASYSDTAEVVSVACVNGAFSSGTPHCSGGSDATTTTQKDALGRTTSVTEPTGDVTSYGYDVLGKLTSVAQGVQARSFEYDRFGFLRKETTPEKGVVTYDAIGSLGNVTQQTEAGSPTNLVISRTFDFAGRLKSVTSNEPRTYVTNAYDETGRGSSAGKLTTSVSTNYALPATSTVTDAYWYSGVGGRLSQKSETLGGTAAFTATQTFGYNSLGLLASHAHPRAGTDAAFTVSWSFDAGLPVAGLVNGATVVSAISYQPSGSLASYTTNNGAGHSVTTSILQNGALSRPSRIQTTGASSNFDSGAYAYDGAGNIRATGNDTFSYDLRSRLSAASVYDYGGARHDETFAYDRYGNMLSRTADGSGVTFPAIDPRTNRFVEDSYTKYDVRGNLKLYGVSNYAYDGLSRQTSFQVVGSVDEHYLYDAAGERVARVVPGATTTSGGYFYNVTPCRLFDSRVSTPGIPAAGQRTIAAWNLCGIPASATALAANVTSVNIPVNGFLRAYPAGLSTPPLAWVNAFRVNQPTATQTFISLNGPMAGSFTLFGDFPYGSVDAIVDVDGYFIQQTTTTPDRYSFTLRDPQNRLTTKYNLAGGAAALDKDYVYVGNQLVATWQPATGYSFFMTDHLGTPRLQTDVNATMVTKAKTRAFGMPLAGALPAQGPEYASMEKDSASGNHYDHARFYTSWLGRFQAPDVLGGKPEDPQSWNRYAYALNNPLNVVDPMGLYDCKSNESAGECATNSALDRGGAVSSVEVTADAPKTVGAPSTAESFIPIWGSGRAAINDFQTGHPFWGTVNGAIAVSDVFIVRKAAMSLGQGAWKFGSHAWRATRSWYGQTRGLAKGTPVHHWLIEQNSALGKMTPAAIKNQPWNLMPMESMAFHNMVHGVGPDGFNFLGRAIYGTPGWAKLTVGSGIGHAIEPFELGGGNDE